MHNYFLKLLFSSKLAKKELEIKKEAYYGVNASPCSKSSTPFHITKSTNATNASGGRAPRKTSNYFNFSSAKLSSTRKTENKLSVAKNIISDMSPTPSPILANSLKVNLMASAKTSLAPCGNFASQASKDKQQTMTNLNQIKISPVFKKSSPKKVNFSNLFQFFLY